MLEAIKKTFQDFNGYSDYEPCISILNGLISETAKDEGTREELSNREDSWLEIRNIIDILRDVELDNVNISQYLRVIKAIVFVSRNLSVGNRRFPQELLIPNSLISLYSKLRISLGPEQLIKELYIAICEFYFNCTINDVVFDRNSIDEHVAFFTWSIDVLDGVPGQMLVSRLIVNLMESTEFLACLFEAKRSVALVENVIMNQLVMKRTELPIIIKNKNNQVESLSPLAISQLRIFKKLVPHESFGSYLRDLHSNLGFAKLKATLDMACLTITSFETWDKFELTGIMSWCFAHFEIYSNKASLFFSNNGSEVDYNVTYLVLESLLDILTNLAQYEHVQKYILAYNGLEKIIILFDVLEKNCLKLQLNKSLKAGSKIPFKAMDYLGNVVTSEHILRARVNDGIIDESNFPGIKCYLVEILGFMAYGQEKTQDKIRELHGLELVLSNCIIDDNNPFLKERCILCLKYLLANNQKNQDFVANLEAKKPVDDSILEKAGYEVTVDSKGSIKLLPSNRERFPENELLNTAFEEITD